MATQLKPIEPDEQTGTALAPIIQDQRAVVFVDKQALDDFLAKHRGRAAHISKDASTKQGRQEMQSFETDMRREKAKIDRDRKAVTKDLRDIVSKVNEQGNEIEAVLDALIDETCGPLAAWKEAEKIRIAECESAITFLKNAAIILADDTLETILTRGGEVKAAVIDAERYGSLYEPAVEAKKAAFFALKEAHGRLTKEAEERAEAKRIADRLAELEAEKAEREQAEADAKAIEEEAKAALKRQSDYASAIIRHIRECREARIDGKSYAWAICLNDVENRIETGDEAVRAFGDRADEVAREAGEASVYIRQQIADEAERHREEVAEQAAKDAREQADREREEERRKEREDAQAKIDEANKRARDLEEAEELRKQQAEQKERDDKIEADRLAEIERKRVANINHRTRVRTGIEQAFMARGADDATAHKIAGDIIAGLIANIEVKF